MTTVLNTALAGMNRSMRAVETATNNVANVNTDGFRAQRYDARRDTVSPRYNDPPANPIAEPDAQTPSEVDLATEFVDIKRNEIAYRANATVVTVADRMMGDLIDILA